MRQLRKYYPIPALAAVVLGALSVITMPASAATCVLPTGDITGKVITNAGCEIGTANNDSETAVNNDQIFGLNDWEFLGKNENTGGDFDGTGAAYGDLDLTITGTTLAGDWSISGYTDGSTTYNSVMLVFKDGSDIPPYYVAYLLDGSTSGTYETPFLSDPQLNPKNISHISIYGSLTAVPLPAAVWLFGSALIGLFGIGRLRKQETL